MPVSCDWSPPYSTKLTSIGKNSLTRNNLKKHFQSAIVLWKSTLQLIMSPSKDWTTAKLTHPNNWNKKVFLQDIKVNLLYDTLALRENSKIVWKSVWSSCQLQMGKRGRGRLVFVWNYGVGLSENSKGVWCCCQLQMGKRGQGTTGLLCPKTEEEWLTMMTQVLFCCD